MARLVPIEGEPLDPVVWSAGVRTLGRDPASSVLIDHSQVSRQHARVEIRNDTAWIADAGSRNGTRVNGRRIATEQRLEDGDLVEVGPWKARFESGEGGARFVLEDGRSTRTHVGQVATIGRDERATLTVRDTRISRVHATISFRAGTFVLRDAGSTNGTFLAGRRVVERELASGDEIVLGADEGGEGDIGGGPARPAARIRVEIAPGVCTLRWQIPRPAELDQTGAMSASLLDATRPVGLRTELVAAGAGAGAAPAAAPGTREPGAAVVEPSLLGRARHRSQRWVPTADLAGHPVRRLLALLLGGSSLTFGLWAVSAEREDLVGPGPLRAVHDSGKFADLAGGRPVCAACHEAWVGVPDAGCRRCHAADARVASAHAALDLRCASCHPEHREGSAWNEPIERHRCTDCHARAHHDPPAAADPARLFLNRSATAPRIHAGHRSLDCARCHATEADAESGRLTSACSDCHGGKLGVADARCASCHRFHELREPVEDSLPAAPLP